MKLDEVRNCLRRAMTEKSLSLRDLAELTGVSFATLSRLLRGKDPNTRTREALERFLEGKPKKEIEPICVRRFKVGGKTFIVEIREEPK